MRVIPKCGRKKPRPPLEVATIRLPIIPITSVAFYIRRVKTCLLLIGAPLATAQNYKAIWIQEARHALRVMVNFGPKRLRPPVEGAPLMHLPIIRTTSMAFYMQQVKTHLIPVGVRPAMVQY